MVVIPAAAPISSPAIPAAARAARAALLVAAALQVAAVAVAPTPVAPLIPPLEQDKAPVDPAMATDQVKELVRV